MLKNWSRISLASFLVLLLGAPVAFATTARVRSLANVGDYISDDSAVNRWYSTLTSFANQVNAEMGTWDGSDNDDRGLSWILACGEDGKWGTYRISLNEDELNNPGFWIGNPFYQNHMPVDVDGVLGGVLANQPVNRWDLAGGWELGENMALGLSVTQSKWRYEDTAATTERSNSWLTVGAGFTWTNNDNMTLDAAVNFGSAGGEYTTAPTGTNSAEWDSKAAYDVLARLFYDWKDNVTLVPVAEYTYSDYSVSTNDDAVLNPVPNGAKQTDFMVGVGVNMDVNQDNMLVFAAEVMNRKYEDSNADATSTERTQTYLPTMRLALESHITSWLTTRVGAAKHLVNEKTESAAGEVSGGVDSPFIGVPDGFDWTIGCGFNVAEWTIDLELADETPFNLGYWLTGYSETNDGPISRISAVYNY